MQSVPLLSPVFNGVRSLIQSGFISCITVKLSFINSQSGDFMKDRAVYEDLVDFKTLKTFMENQLEDYNMEPGIIGMDLVLFKDAIEHGMFFNL